jgi:hypothetical protein
VRSAEVVFLRARYDELEQIAIAASKDAASPWRWQDTPHGYGLVGDHPVQGAPMLAWVVPAAPGVHPLRAPAEHIARHDPAAVLADIAAKRDVLEHYEHWQKTFRLTPEGWTAATCTVYRMAMSWVVGLLVQEYAVHPDYDPDWAGPALLAAEWRTEDES